MTPHPHASTAPRVPPAPAPPPYTPPKIIITLSIPAAYAPAFRAAVIDMSQQIGGALSERMPFARENALQRSLHVVADLRRQVCAQVAASDPDWRLATYPAREVA